MEAWLAFLSDDSPEMIIKLLEEYPEFKPLYEHVYDMCRNVEKVMDMYSKELLEMDRNTVQYMIDEMQEEINRKDMQLEQNVARLNQQNIQLNQQNIQLEQQSMQLKQKDTEIEQMQKKYQEAMEKYEELLKKL